MSTQRNDLFSVEGGIAARDAAIAAADRHAAVTWKANALAAVQQLARSREFLTTDDVWRLAPCETHEPRALGGIMRSAATAGLIEATDRTQNSERVACHRRPLRIWRSLVYRAGGAGAS